MDFSKLNQNERMAAIAAAVAVVAGLVGFSYSVTILGVLFAVGLLVVIFLPMLGPNTRLPGSKGSLMLVTGGVSAVLFVLSLLVSVGTVFNNFVIRDLFFLIAVAAAVAAGWFSWQQFGAEGGKFQLGTTGMAPPSSAAPPPVQPPPAQPGPPPPAAPPPPAEGTTVPPGSAVEDEDERSRQP